MRAALLYTPAGLALVGGYIITLWCDAKGGKEERILPCKAARMTHVAGKGSFLTFWWPACLRILSVSNLCWCNMAGTKRSEGTYIFVTEPKMDDDGRRGDCWNCSGLFKPSLSLSFCLATSPPFLFLFYLSCTLDKIPDCGIIRVELWGTVVVV